MLTGAHDGRVDPMHSRKFAARMQAATRGSAPVLLLENDRSGHGIGTALDVRIETIVDVYAFLFWQLGMKVTSVPNRAQMQPQPTTGLPGSP